MGQIKTPKRALHVYFQSNLFISVRTWRTNDELCPYFTVLMTAEATLPADAEVRHFDHVMMTYMRERHIPGASIAVSVGGQFLVRKGTFPLKYFFHQA